MFSLPAEKPSYHIILLRHGESVGNVEGYHQGQSDFPLTERGRAQARALVRRWQKEKRSFDVILSSPLSRARETAEMIATALGAPIQLEPLWAERDNGILAGKRPDEFPQTRPGFFYPYRHVGETGESQWELYLRAGRALQGLLNHPPGEYLVVSHGGILNMVFYAILGITPHANFQGPRFRFGNTAFASLAYQPNEHKWYVLGVNDRWHWKPTNEH